MNIIRVDRNHINNKLTLSVFFAIFCTTTALLLSPTRAMALSGSSFQAGNIISNAVFTNSSAMSEQDIQNFLNTQVGTCDTYGTQSFTAPSGQVMTHAQWGAENGNPEPYTCINEYYENTTTLQNNYSDPTAPVSGGISAAQIIYNAAQEYQINPEVILTTLQKEQALVTDNWPWYNEYQYAMGYACPDSSGCSTNYADFYQQVDSAAWQFRQYLDNPGTYDYWTGNNYIQYSPDASCGGSTVDIQNAATAALYIYTPYQPDQAALNNLYGSGDSCSAYGNRNFWRDFTNWFGSTQYYEPPDGQLYQDTSTGKVYLAIEDTSTIYSVPTWSMMMNYGINQYQIIPVAPSVLQQFTNGGTLTDAVWDSGGVYLVNNADLYHFPSTTSCTAWNVNCLNSSDVDQLGDFQSEYLVHTGQDLPLVAQYGSSLYYLSGGLIEPIENPQTAETLNINIASEVSLSPENFNNLTLGPLLITTPAFVQFASSDTVYYYDGANYHPVPDPDVLSAWGVHSLTATPTSSYDAIGALPSPMGDNLSYWYEDSQDNKYLISNGKKYMLSTAQQSYWPNVSYDSYTASLVSNLPSGTIEPYIWSPPNVYLMQNGTLDYVPSYNDYVELGVNSSNTTDLSDDITSDLVRGIDAYGDGSLIGFSGNPTVYVVSNHSLLAIPNPGVFNNYGFNWNDIEQASSNIETTYPVINGDAGLTILPNNDYYIGDTNISYYLTPAQAIDYGLLTSTFVHVPGNVTTNLTDTNLSKFLYDSNNGKIYYASGGAIHYVSSYASFVAYGGTTSSVDTVNNSFISNFILEQNI
jgi:hypothetical protein